MKKTFELSNEEIVAIYALFEEVFGQKRDFVRTIQIHLWGILTIVYY